MFRYLLTVLILTTYSGCFGGPVGKKPNGTISDLLESLAKSCPNLFLKQQITSKLDQCKVIVPPYNEQQFVCLMFYDINKQLCDASDSKLPSFEEFTSKINEKLLVETACDQAESWSASDISDVPEYKEKVGVVFQDKFSCAKVCGDPEVTSQNTNFFCKYFKWGSEVLSVNISQKVQEKMATVKSVAGNENKPHTLVKTIQVIPNPVKVIVKLPDASNTQANSIISNVSDINSSSVAGVKTQNLLSKWGLQQTSVPQSNNEEQVPSNEEQDKFDIEAVNQRTEKLKLPSPSVSPSGNAFDRPSESEVEPPRSDDDGTIITGDNPLKDQKKPSNEQNNAVDQADADYDLGEGKGNDDDDGSPNDTDQDGGEVDKPTLNEEVKPPNKIETSMSFARERELLPHIMPDEYTTDDDHFFPMFLTGVILVVVLYVLYHNKSKVTKVVLGLIVEGRQPGRRRNSRGHAYRRLDTLEQAMSTNTAAPPSKIIY